MGKKKKQSMGDIVKIVKDINKKTKITTYCYTEKMFINKNDNESIILIPSKTIWDHLIEDDEIKHLMIPLDPSNKEDRKLIDLKLYCNDLNSGWYELDSVALYNNEAINIEIDNFSYNIKINKSLLPLKLNKADYNNIFYKIYYNEHIVLGLKKIFIFDCDDCNISLIKLFQII